MIIKAFFIILQKTTVSRKSHLPACHPDVLHHRACQYRRSDHQSVDTLHQIRHTKDTKCITDKFSEKFSNLPCSPVHFHCLLFQTQCIQIFHRNLILLFHKVLYFQAEVPFLFSRFLAEHIGKGILTGSHLHRQRNGFSLTPVIITQLRDLLPKIKSYQYISDFVHFSASICVLRMEYRKHFSCKMFSL